MTHAVEATDTTGNSTADNFITSSTHLVDANGRDGSDCPRKAISR